MYAASHGKNFAGWAFSVYRKILRIAPVPILVVAAGTLLSQLLRLAAFFLPLKILILIGQTGVPRYFPSALQTLDREILILGLGVATLCAYGLHLAAERLVARFTEESATRLLERADKLVLFANQAAIARSACRRLAETLAALLFHGLALLLILFLHPSLTLFSIAWCAACLLCVELAAAADPRFRIWLEEKSAPFLATLSALGFLGATAVIVVEYVAGASFNILFAIVALLMTREALQQLARGIGNAIALNGTRPFVTALFFRGHAWTAAATAPRRDVWEWAMRDGREGWLARILQEATGEEVATAGLTRWHQTGMTDHLVFDASAKTRDGRSLSCLVKLFAPSRHVWSAHEKALLHMAAAADLPAPRLLKTGRIGDFAWHVYRPLGQPGVEIGKVQAQMRGACLAFRLPAELSIRYVRSHPLLGRRLKALKVDRMRLVADGPECAAVERFAGMLDELSSRLERMPLAIHNPDLFAPPLALAAGERPVATHWTRWTLEPIGGGWPVRPADLKTIPEWLDRARAVRADLTEVTAPQVELCALLFALEKTILGERYRSAIEMLPQIFSVAEAAGLAAAKPEPAVSALGGAGTLASVEP